MQPAYLSPVLHGQHPFIPLGSINRESLSGGQTSGVDTGLAFRRRRHAHHRPPPRSRFIRLVTASATGPARVVSFGSSAVKRNQFMQHGSATPMKLEPNCRLNGTVTTGLPPTSPT